MKRTMVERPKEKARVDSARATRPRRYGTRRDEVLSANQPAIAVVNVSKTPIQMTGYYSLIVLLGNF